MRSWIVIMGALALAGCPQSAPKGGETTAPVDAKKADAKKADAKKAETKVDAKKTDTKAPDTKTGMSPIPMAKPGQELPPGTEVVKVKAPVHIPVVGVTTPDEVAKKHEVWGRAKIIAEDDLDKAVAKKLLDVKPGAEVTVYFGTWCRDCFLLVPRTWRAIEVAERDTKKKVPFQIKYIGVDEQFMAGSINPMDEKVARIPTFIVKRDGKEVGRIIESSPRGIEQELVDMINGKTRGIVTNSKDMLEKMGQTPK